jgi:catalase
MFELNQFYNTMQTISDFNRERIPERVTHAKGTGVYGNFYPNSNGKKFTKAKIFRVGSSKIFVRFSNYKGEKGSPDTLRDPRGMAVRFFNEYGNWDFLGNNLPVFFIKDPSLSVEFIHSQKRNPKTNLFDPNQTWDFYSKHPQVLHAVLMVYGERGIPFSYRFMNSYSCHSFFWENENNLRFLVKLQFKSNQGIKNLNSKDAKEIIGENPDFYSYDLIDSISKDDFPSWKLLAQIVPFEDINLLKYSPFDSTLIIPTKDVPFIELGDIVLNKTVDNYFNEVEESAFSPANLPLGMSISPDPLLISRVFSYSDAQKYRLGVNYQSIPINQNLSSSNRDGYMNTNHHSNSNPKGINFIDGIDKLWNYNPYQQPSDFLKLLDKNQISNLVFEIKNELKLLKPSLQNKMIFEFSKISNEFASNFSEFSIFEPV